MGSGYNNSLASGRSARNRASTRTPVHFWLDVPMYEYDLGCGLNGNIHTYLSRTPVMPRDTEDFSVLWCERCQDFRVLDSENPEPLNQPTTNDDKISFEQDKGTLRERIARAVQDLGYLSNDSQIMDLAIKYGVPVSEIKKINAGLTAPDKAGEADMCKAGLHEMTIDNTRAKTRKNGSMFRICILCEREANRKRMAKTRK